MLLISGYARGGVEAHALQRLKLSLAAADGTLDGRFDKETAQLTSIERNCVTDSEIGREAQPPKPQERLNLKAERRKAVERARVAAAALREERQAAAAEKVAKKKSVDVGRQEMGVMAGDIF